MVDHGCHLVNECMLWSFGTRVPDWGGGGGGGPSLGSSSAILSATAREVTRSTLPMCSQLRTQVELLLSSFRLALALALARSLALSVLVLGLVVVRALQVTEAHASAHRHNRGTQLGQGALTSQYRLDCGQYSRRTDSGKATVARGTLALGRGRERSLLYAVRGTAQEPELVPALCLS